MMIKKKLDEALNPSRKRDSALAVAASKQNEGLSDAARKENKLMLEDGAKRSIEIDECWRRSNLRKLKIKRNIQIQIDNVNSEYHKACADAESEYAGNVRYR